MFVFRSYSTQDKGEQKMNNTLQEPEIILFITHVKNCDTNIMPHEYPLCTQARSLCKSKNGSIFQTNPGLFKDRFKSCRKYDADFCKSDLLKSDKLKITTLDTPTVDEFSNIDSFVSVWTDFKRFNDTHFRSLSTGTIIGNLGREDTSFYAELSCHEQGNFRYTGSPWLFQSLPVVLSDLLGNLRLGITNRRTHFFHSPSFFGPKWLLH